jgi:hypothetical protein
VYKQKDDGRIAEAYVRRRQGLDVIEQELDLLKDRQVLFGDVAPVSGGMLGRDGRWGWGSDRSGRSWRPALTGGPSTGRRRLGAARRGSVGGR